MLLDLPHAAPYRNNPSAAHGIKLLIYTVLSCRLREYLFEWRDMSDVWHVYHRDHTHTSSIAVVGLFGLDLRPNCPTITAVDRQCNQHDGIVSHAGSSVSERILALLTRHHVTGYVVAVVKDDERRQWLVAYSIKTPFINSNICTIEWRAVSHQSSVR